MCARVHDVRAHVCLCVCSLFTCVTGRPPGTHRCGHHGPPGRGPLACSPAGRPGSLAGLGLAPCSRPPAAGARLRAPPPPAGVEGCTGSPSLGARALSPRPFPPQDMPCQRFPLLALAGLLSLGSGESCRTFRVRKDVPPWGLAHTPLVHPTIRVLPLTAPPRPPPRVAWSPARHHAPPQAPVAAGSPLMGPVSPRPQCSPRSAPSTRSAPARTASSRGPAAPGVRSW